MLRCAPSIADNPRRSVPADTFQGLVVSLVLSRLDHGNATLAGLTAYLLSELQAVMNAGARLILSVDRCEHHKPPPHRGNASECGTGFTPLLRQLRASCSRVDYF